MTLALVRKLLRDVRLTLAVVALLLGAYQVLWAKITERVLGKLVPLAYQLGGLGGLSPKDLEDIAFEGPGKLVRTLIGGERVVLDNATDLLSIGYVHPLVVTILCIWAVGRAAGAVAGEIDRGTMELLLSQPVARSRLILAHLGVDLLTIPVLCLSLWAGNWAGALLIGQTITPEEVRLKERPPGPNVVVEVGPLRVRLEQPARRSREPSERDRQRMDERLRVEPERFGPALWLVGGLVFAVCGYTMWLSSAGRFRWRVLGVAVFVTLVQFLVNLIGQMWPVLEPLRPLTVFYYYQPQQVILGGGWDVTLREWNGGAPLGRVPMPAVLYGVGLAGYALALWTLHRRDLPAPL